MNLTSHALAYGYPGRVVGRHLDLEIGAGEVLCILGPNGAGKTTLLRTLLGLLPPLGGHVAASGRDLARLPRPAIARALAYVPQSSSSLFDFTLLELVEMGRTAHLGAFARPGRVDRELSMAALARLGIGELAERALGAVSGGERQLALIARALATEARVLVMDEPTAGLDFGNQSRVLEEIARIKADGISVLLATHDPDHAFHVAERVLMLERGGVFAQGDTAQVLGAENLSRLYGVEVHVAEVETPAGRRRVCVPALPAPAGSSGGAPGLFGA
jgi:iron complex transport system ATP-binding protein